MDGFGVNYNERGDVLFSSYEVWKEEMLSFLLAAKLLSRIDNEDESCKNVLSKYRRRKNQFRENFKPVLSAVTEKGTNSESDMNRSFFCQLAVK